MPPDPLQHVSRNFTASSGQTVRHRLNRGGDRQLNRALHTIVMWRTNFHTESRAYLVKRRHEGQDRSRDQALSKTSPGPEDLQAAPRP